MNLAKRFGATLAQIRQEQGFPGPHVFFRSREGRRNLGLTFANYLNIERGRSLPKNWRLKRILRALDLPDHAPRARELVRAYVAALVGSEDVLEVLGRPDSQDREGDAWRLAEDAARQAMTQRAVQFSLDQWRVIARDAASYACYTYLVNTPGWTTLGELARLTGFSPGPVKRALRALAKSGVAETARGRARCPFARKWVRAPAPLAAASGLMSAAYRYRQQWIDKPAKLSHHSFLTVRMEGSALDRYQHHLSEAVKLASVYGDVEKSEGTAVYLVEGRVYKVFP